MVDTDLIFDTADGVLAVDQGQKVVLWNGGAEALLGFNAREVLGRSCNEVFGGRDESGRIVCRASCHDMMLTRRREPVRTHDMLVRTKAGREKWVSVSTVQVRCRRKDLSLLVHVFRDVSGQKETERLIERLLFTAAKFSLSPGADPPVTPSLSSPPMEHLTRREREVLRLLAAGTSTEAIATKLGISPATARNHITNILTKLGAHSRLEAVALALRNGLI
jgi:PAS domain S-box-containing protein